jgi:uncharacterized repeat protein (TIGR01451 family)
MSSARTVLAADPIVSDMEDWVVVTKDGKESFTRTTETKLFPGSVIEYRINYTNKGKEAITALKVNGPVPKGTMFVASSATANNPHNLRYSLDGGLSWQEAPLKRKQKDATGKEVEVVVQPEDYTNVQWSAQAPLKPQGTQQYRYRVRVKS